MSTKIPVSLEGNLTADPDYGVSENGTKWARFQLAINERIKNPDSGEWEDGTPAFHRVTSFGRAAENVRDSLAKGDTAIVIGDLKQTQWVDTKTGEPRQGSEVIADSVGVSLKYRTATVNRVARTATVEQDVDVSATGPVTQPTAGATGPTVH